MDLHVVVTPSEEAAASKISNHLVHATYRIGTNGVLLRGQLANSITGGLMGLTDETAPRIPYPQKLVRSVLQECQRRQYTGVVADFDRAPAPDRISFLQELYSSLATQHLVLFVPERYATTVPGAFVLLCTALSGGSYKQRLQDACNWYSNRRLALDVARIRADFLLPCPGGEGTPLSTAAFSQLRQAYNTPCFFSQDLCAKYFTYLENGQAHFVMFDDAQTLLKKCHTEPATTFAHGFFLYAETASLLPQILSAHHSSTPPVRT